MLLGAIAESDDAKSRAAGCDLCVGTGAFDQALRPRLNSASLGVAAIIEIERRNISAEQAKTYTLKFAAIFCERGNCISVAGPRRRLGGLGVVAVDLIWRFRFFSVSDKKLLL